ncbi:TPA: glycosyltransferase [Proteus mirabilis]|uniref:glycosyltransferase n=1 Tax=Proteus mirabilis TaxID=584 RepID=UPI001A1F1272|nr:glycosyltransferase [Proteus mirabilis]MCT8228459.1 glycosyltransferase [Proteus mirabilis]MDF7247339.1 glycosyltransferase [Proteus mirabilis]MDF7406872.1 glycosyltransferase [Proteus mirabilis]MDF7431551.1 glycosyltransferase [Proteus mirabilis]HAT4484166.1 glycosyltransferase [Proteus mirabilis]
MYTLTPPNDENSIKKYWKYIDRVYTSCICITYNQELYIKNTIDSLLSQQTEYKFEIIVHDDCSSDATRDILLEYKYKYPNIIKLILQKKNQYSQGKRIFEIPVKIAQGKYICLCEGDDYWIDKYKIQKQIKILEKYRNYNICFTPAKGLKIKSCNDLSYYKSEITFFTLTNVVEGGGDFMPTASLMIRKHVFDNIPEWCSKAPVGDYFLQILASLNNGAIYIPDFTVVYRISAIGSWTSLQKKISSEKIMQFTNDMLFYIDKLYFENKNYIDIETINKAKAIQEINSAYKLIFTGHLELAKKMIIRSWKRAKSINKKQNLIYFSRNFLFLIYLMMKIKTHIKEYMEIRHSK